VGHTCQFLWSNRILHYALALRFFGCAREKEKLSPLLPQVVLSASRKKLLRSGMLKNGEAVLQLRILPPRMH
jgi:hypothetical protein